MAIKFDPLVDKISSVELLDYMGDEITIVNAARVSFNKESTWEGLGKRPYFLKAEDAKLIKYLYTHNHWTPFGHVQLQFRIKAPIFVARQLVKHQVGLVWNEASRRYVDDTPEFYIPETLRLRPPDGIKQGSSDETTNAWHQKMLVAAKEAAALYNSMIDAGVAPEEARMILPLNMYTEWIWTGSLQAFLRIVGLRTDRHSQSQTRVYGQAFKDTLHLTYPHLYAAIGEK